MNRLLTVLVLAATTTAARSGQDTKATVYVYLQHDAGMGAGTLPRAGPCRSDVREWSD